MVKRAKQTKKSKKAISTSSQVKRTKKEAASKKSAALKKTSLPSKKTRVQKSRIKPLAKPVTSHSKTKAQTTKSPLKLKQDKPIEKAFDLSVIIVSLNTKDLTQQTIETVLKASTNIKTEIIVVDNASSDGSLKMLEGFGSKIKVIRNLRNLGFGSANDRGCQLASGRFLLFLNSDTIVPKDTLGKIVNFMREHPSIGIASPKLVDNDHSHSVQRGSFGQFTTPLRTIFRLSRRQPQLNKKQFYTLTDWVSGAAMVMRHDLYFYLNGFDENIFLYFEDQDICKRAKSLDYDIAVINNAEIIHLCGKSSNKNFKTKFYDRSQNYFMAKHYGLVWAGLIHLLRIPYRKLK